MKYNLLRYHMQDVNPNYMFSHASVAGKLADKQLNTYEEYVKECKHQGITYYNEVVFNQFMEDTGRVKV